MNIAEILTLPTNANVTGVFTVKTAKKLWEDSEGWMHQVLLTDSTGEMLADFHVGAYSPIQRGVQLELFEAMTQHGEKGIRLYVEIWGQLGEPISEPPEDSYLSGFRMAQREIKNKIRCRYGEVYLLKYDKEGVLDFLKSKLMDDIVEELTK